MDKLAQGEEKMDANIESVVLSVWPVAEQMKTGVYCRCMQFGRYGAHRRGHIAQHQMSAQCTGPTME